MKRINSVEPKIGASAAVMEPDDDMSAPTQEAIANLAHSYWEARGGKGGSPWDDWFRAEQELKRRQEL